MAGGKGRGSPAVRGGAARDAGPDRVVPARMRRPTRGSAFFESGRVRVDCPGPVPAGRRPGGRGHRGPADGGRGGTRKHPDLRRAGDRVRAQGAAAGGLELYRRVQQHGLATGVHQALAEEYAEAGEWEKAEIELRHTIALGHYDARTLDLCRDLALRYMGAGRRESAQSLLALVLDLRRGDRRALEALHGLLYEDGAHDEAEVLQLRYLLHQYETRYAVASAQLRQDRIRIRLRLVKLYLKLGRLEPAGGVLEEAVDVNGDVDVPLAVQARLLLAGVYCRMGRPELASGQVGTGGPAGPRQPEGPGASGSAAGRPMSVTGQA